MDKKISQLTAAATLTGTELLPIVQGGVTVQTTAQDIADLGGGGSLPVVNTYPVTTPGSAGTRFWYKGNEWHYMTQDEIDSTGWTGLVTVGFPAPVSKNPNQLILLNGNIIFDRALLVTPSGTSNFTAPVSELLSAGYLNKTFIFDFIGLGDPTRYTSIPDITSACVITSFKNVNLLTNLQNRGTDPAITIRNTGSVTDTQLNQLFTDLPLTTKTVTLDVRNNPGSLTCNPAIATSKGYTVVTT